MSLLDRYTNTDSIVDPLIELVTRHEDALADTLATDTIAVVNTQTGTCDPSCIADILPVANLCMIAQSWSACHAPTVEFIYIEATDARIDVGVQFS